MYEPLDKELTIITPEQVQLQFQTAGLGSRVLAHLLDSLILLVVNIILVMSALGIGRLYRGQWMPSVADYLIAIGIIVFVLLNLGYFVCTEAFMGGQTPGKRIIGLRVLQNNGQSATLLSIIIRNLFRLLDMLPTAYFLGAVAMMFSSKDKRIGDMAAGTIVVIETRSERVKRKRRIEKAITKWRHLVPMLELTASMRQAVTSDDWQLLQAWIERLPTMHKANLQQLAAPIAQHYSRKIEISLSDPSDPAAFLIAIYEQIRVDWEV